MFKKFICAAFAAALAGVCAPSVCASDGVFTVSSGTVKAGGNVTLDVSVRDTDKLTAVRLFVKYDASVFTITDADTVDFGNMTLGPTGNEPYTFLWIDGLSTAKDGTFVRLTFSCDEEAPSGDYDFSLFYEEEDCIDVYGYPLDFDIEEGHVTVTGGKPAETQKPVTTKSGDQTTAATTKMTDKKSETKTDKKTTTTAKTETDTQTSSSTSDSKTTTSADSSEPDESVTTTTTSASQTEQGTVTTPSSSDNSSEEETATAAAASQDSSSENDKQDTTSKKGFIAIIALIGLIGAALAVWLVHIIKKEK